MHQRIFGLDLLRAIAILVVVEQHGREFLYSAFPSVQKWPLTDGVDLFFVLSGFLIGGILVRNLLGPATDLKTVCLFWMRRWIRTLPNYYLILALNIFALWLLHSQINGSDIWHYGFFVQNFASPLPAHMFFSESWSLAIEEWFYLLFPLTLILVVPKCTNLRASTRLFLAVLLTVVLSLLKRSYDFAVTPNLSWEVWNLNFRTLVTSRLDSIAIGVGAAGLKSFFPDWWRRPRHIYVLLVLGLVAALALDRTSVLRGRWGEGWFAYVGYFTAYGLGVACLLPFLDSVRSGAENVPTRAIAWVSKISYSLYLVHNSLTKEFIRFFAKTFAMSPLFSYALYWLVSLLCASALYKLWEKPFLKWRDRRFAEKQN